MFRRHAMIVILAGLAGASLGGPAQADLRPGDPDAFRDLDGVSSGKSLQLAGIRIAPLSKPEPSKSDGTRRPEKLADLREDPAFVARICRQIERAAQDNELPPAFLAKLIWKESWFDPHAISPKGAEGIAQFMPETAARWGLRNSFEPMEAIAASATLLSHLARGYGNLGLAAAAYNAGERRVDAYLAGRSGLPAETRDYVASITGHGAKVWKAERHKTVAFELDATRPFREACAEMPVLKAPLQKAFANTYFNRGLSLTAKQDYADAIARYSVAIRLKSDFPDAYNNRGIAYRRMGDYEAAIANYDVAIRLKPSYANAYNNRGYALRKLDRFEEAIADYDKAIRLKPGYVAALFNRGYAKARLGRHDEAVADYTRALKIAPKHILSLYNRALSRKALGALKQAAADLDRVIALKPKLARAYFQRALIRHEAGRKQKAKADYLKAVSLESGFANARFVDLFK
ncbi:tetratricopeptide repeat protein [Breoghania sp.]|uniref:tetratricopeptide repeat protein n=1 Tax=Breoghania sp. TaxID=2065378 RepID=UPI002AA669FE|nr:tetratricopeptide repeat protein [Breoghania sp.]